MPFPAAWHYSPLVILPAPLGTLRRWVEGGSAFRRGACTLLFTILGCGGQKPVVSAPTTAPVVTRVDLLSQPWMLRAPMTPRAQRVAVSAVLTSRMNPLTAADSGRNLTRVDTLASVLDARLEALRDRDAAERTSEFRLSELRLQVSRFVVRAGPDTAWREPANVSAPFSLSVLPQRGAVPALCPWAPGAPGAPAVSAVSAVSATACAAAQVAAAEGWQELWVGAPRALQPGTTWRDSTSRVLVRDEIPLTVTSVRTFTVRDAVLRGGAVVVTVERRSTQVLAGEGRQFGELVQLSGTGEGTMRLEIALDDGAILSGVGTSSVLLRLVGRRRTQELTQLSQTTITAP